MSQVMAWHLLSVCVILLLQCSRPTIQSSGVFQVVSRDKPLYAVSGEDLILPCSLKPNMSAEGMTVEWFRLNPKELNPKEQVHLYKENKDQNDKQIQSYRGRTTLFKEDLKKGNASLKLASVQVSDEGDYKCWIQSESHYDDADLQVTVRGIGQTPRIISEGIRLDGGISLVCESEGWKPEPVLEWLDSKGRLLAAETLEINASPNGFKVKRQLVAYNSDADHYVCKLTQTDERTVLGRTVEMASVFHISDGAFIRPWKFPSIIFLTIIIIVPFTVGVTMYYVGKRKRQRLWKLVENTEEKEGDFHLKEYPEQGLKKMIPLVKVSERVWLNQCHLSKATCELVASVLQRTTTLTDLDMSNNNLGDEGLEVLCVGLKDSKCHLQTLRVADCNLTDKSCEIVATVVKSFKSLIELDLSTNDLRDSGVLLLSNGLSSTNCKLRTLRLCNCGISVDGYVCLALTLMLNPFCVKELDLTNNPGESAQKVLSDTLEDPHRKIEAIKFADYKLTDKPCEIVASLLQSPNSLTELDLSHNDLGDYGGKLISDGLSSPHCKLHTLRLSDCLISEKGCIRLASALTQNPSHLEELDLSYNHPGESGLKLLSAKLEDPACKLEILRTDHVSLNRARPRLLRYACKLTLDPNTAHRNLSLSEGNRKVTYFDKEQLYPDHPERFDYCWYQVLCREGLSGRCYWEAEWIGGSWAHIAVAYKSIKRKGEGYDIILGHNDKSWSLICSPDSYSVRHNNNPTAIPANSSGSRRVGVYLDSPAGTLSFYSVSSDTLIPLHTFHSTFTEPLYPGFRVYIDSSVSLCQIT